MKIRSVVVVVLSFALAPLLAGCPTTGVYRTARTLNAGEVDVGFLVSGTHVTIPGDQTTDPQTGQTTTGPSLSLTFINYFPEVSLHYGVTDNVEFGGRLALSSLMGELDFKLRLIGDRNSSTHLAIDPSVGAQTLFIIEGWHATLPLIFTTDLARNVSLNLAAYVGYRNLHVTSASSDSSTSNLDRLAVDTTTVGGSVGVEFRGEKGYFMPLVDVSSTVNTFRGGDPSTTADASARLTFVIFGVAFGLVPGRGALVPPPPSYPYPTAPPGYTPPPPPPPGYGPPPPGTYPPAPVM